MTVDRICVLSAVRVSAIANLDYEDFSYSVVADGVYSVLEPCLGVINASLPVLQPVADKIGHSRMFSFLRGSSYAKSSGRQLRSQTSDRSDLPSVEFGFNRLTPQGDKLSHDDEFPLAEFRTHVRGGVHV